MHTGVSVYVCIYTCVYMPIVVCASMAVPQYMFVSVYVNKHVCMYSYICV